MNRYARTAGAALFILLSLLLSGVAAAGEPLELLKAATESVFTLLKDPQLKTAARRKERVERLKDIINPIFDYEEVARRTLASHWRGRTAAEQAEFTALFRAFLEKIYSDRIDLYDGERVNFVKETVDRDFAEVESKLVNRENEESQVIYRLQRKNGQWKVYDAVVENISIVNNYRSQFQRVIAKSSYEELKRLLRQKAGS